MRRRRGRGRLRVATVLALVVAMPVLVMGAFTVVDTIEAQRQRSMVDEIKTVELGPAASPERLASLATRVARLAVLTGDDGQRQRLEQLTVELLTTPEPRALDDAVERLRGEADLLAESLSVANRWASLGRAAIMALTLGLLWVASVMITRPLRRLAVAAEALRDGQFERLGEDDLARGPTEIRAVGTALDEAGLSVRLAEAQAIAIAEGRLDDPSLSTVAPGRLGASLQEAVGRLARSLSEREDYRLRLSHEASHDALTGLVNRAAACDHLGGALGRARRTRRPLALVFLDFAGFKALNETYGHEAGDEMLRHAAEVLIAAVRPDDLVGRLGGDEFVVIAEDVGTVEDAAALAQRLVVTMGTAVEVGRVQHRLAARAGVRVLLPDDPVGQLPTAAAVAELLRDAAAALERAKSPAGEPIELFTPQLHKELRDRLELEQALRHVLETDNGELHLVYQPVVDAVTCAPVGAEALVRWNRPGIGPVSPDLFVPVAERSELIIELDNWVLRTAIRQLAVWAAAGVLGDRWVAVNLSGAHVCRPEIVPQVLGTLAEAGVAPRHLIVELTERELLADVELAASNLKMLRNAGVRVAIDDFGTGFTSLAHLRWLPIDKLKIDKSFVTNLTGSNDESLVRLVIETGHVLGVEVTAEGVETVEHLEALRALGADQIQGYLTGRPEAAVPRPDPPSP